MNEPRAARYQRLRRRVRSAGAVSGVMMLAVVALTPLGALLAGWSASLTAGLPGPAASAAALAVFAAFLVAGWELALAPATIYARAAVTPRYERTAPLDESLAALALAALTVWPAVVVAGFAIQAAVWIAGGWWWIVAGGLVAAALAGVMHAAPAVLARMSDARPVERPALVERLGALARRIRVPIASIDEVSDASMTALVVGSGASRRVFVSSELIRDWADDEIAVVVAHEFAHHAHHDLWGTLALDAAILSVGFWSAGWLAGAAGAALGVAPVGELAALPFVALVAAAVWLAATPLRHALSRHQERRADAFALRLTGGTEAFRTAIRRLAARHLAEDRPSQLTTWLYHRHPPVAERLAIAAELDRRPLQ